MNKGSALNMLGLIYLVDKILRVADAGSGSILNIVCSNNLEQVFLVGATSVYVFCLPE
jgi:hypothetical protein